MKRFNFIFCLLLAATFANVMAQPPNNSVSGFVLDNATKEPLPNANIYISNTTWGTTSKLDGSFILSSIISGNHEIVFSMVGYESQSQSIRLDDTSKIFLRIGLIPKIYKISDITITSNRPEEWYDDLEIFKKKFLGYSPFSLECEFLNEFEINFEHPNEKTLRAKSYNPIEVINYKLGYSVKCEIINFEYTKSQKKFDYTYHLFFTELDTIDEDVKEKWKRNRLKCYKESLAYFLRSICQGDFRENGFEVSLVYKPNSEGLDILSSSDLITKSSEAENYKLNFTDFLKVYNYNIDQENLRTSWLQLNYPSITINKYGYPLENRAIILYGYWAELGMASFLPMYYGVKETE